MNSSASSAAPSPSRAPARIKALTDADRDRAFEQITEDVRRLASQTDAGFVYFHWGKEGSSEVADYQIELAHLCMDLGCKAVFGAHPHRLQGVEVYRDGPIFYSLGNFVFGGNKDPRDKLSALARVRVFQTGAVEAELVPIQITRWPEAPFQPFLHEGAAREEALARIAALSEAFPQTLPMLQGYRMEKTRGAR